MSNKAVYTEKLGDFVKVPKTEETANSRQLKLIQHTKVAAAKSLAAAAMASMTADDVRAASADDAATLDAAADVAARAAVDALVAAKRAASSLQ